MKELKLVEPQSNIEAALISPVPPWTDINLFFNAYFTNTLVKDYLSNEVNDIFSNLRKENYDNFKEIYTDGSLISGPEPSTSSAFVVYESYYKILQKFKISPITSILGAELCAILKALQYVSDNMSHESRVVIYTDSLSGIILLRNRNIKNYTAAVYQIHKIINTLRDRMTVRIQYIPGHKNIEGNEIADKLAKEAHNSDMIDTSIVSTIDCKKEIKPALTIQWKYKWHQTMINTNKGKFIRHVKPNLEQWKWASLSNRRMETAMCRLRIGHAGLRDHLYRFQLAETNLCDCGEVETIDHFLLSCTLHYIERRKLKASLETLKVPVNLRNLLGGGKYKTPIQLQIINATTVYLYETNKIKDL